MLDIREPNSMLNWNVELNECIALTPVIHRLNLQSVQCSYRSWQAILYHFS